jgi:hypothetical protein
MNQGRGPARPPGLAPAARGAALVGLLVIVGIVGLQILDDSGSGSSVTTTTTPVVTTLPTGSTLPTVTTLPTGTTAPTATTRATTSTTKATTATTRASTSTTAAIRKNSDVKVMVYNASGVPGAAANMRDKLKSDGYDVIGIGNLSTQKGLLVQCKDGFSKEAAKLVYVDVQGAQIQGYPAKPPSNAGDADCLVVIGTK